MVGRSSEKDRLLVLVMSEDPILFLIRPPAGVKGTKSGVIVGEASENSSNSLLLKLSGASYAIVVSSDSSYSMHVG